MKSRWTVAIELNAYELECVWAALSETLDGTDDDDRDAIFSAATQEVCAAGEALQKRIRPHVNFARKIMGWHQ